MQEDVKQTTEVFRQGKCALIPTDTGWMVACDAVQDNAVKQAMALCRTTNISDFVLLIDNAGRAQAYLEEMPDIVWDLFEMSDSPLTIRLQHVKNLASTLCTKDAFTAFSVVHNETAKQICFRFRRPIACLPTGVHSFELLDEQLKQQVAYSVRTTGTVPAQKESIIELGKGNLIRIIKE